MCGLASSAFARHYLRNHGCFLFLWVLRCFTSPRSLLLPYVFRQRSPDITPVSFEVSLFGDPRIEARLPAPRGLSQVTTSFVGSWCQGIHRLPLVACCYYKDARVHCEVLKMRAATGPTRRTPVSRPLEGQLLYATEPSGPNSVLGLLRHPSRGSTPTKAGSTNDEFVRVSRLVNVPHSGACPAPVESWKPSAWTDPEICQMAP